MLPDEKSLLLQPQKAGTGRLTGVYGRKEAKAGAAGKGILLKAHVIFCKKEEGRKNFRPSSFLFLTFVLVGRSRPADRKTD